MEIKFEIPQMIKANNPKPITMDVKTREILEAKQGLTDINQVKQLPYDTFEKVPCQPIKETTRQANRDQL